MAARMRSLTVGRTDLDRYVRAMLVAGLLATVVFVVLQDRVLDERLFGNFYDIQARALLNGDLAVPDGTLGLEAFEVDGRQYLYNPPGPSLLRMPVLAVTDRFDGRLTVPSMALAWLTTLTVVSLLLWRVRTMLRGRAPLTNGEAALHGATLLVISLGSTLVYLASLPWVFHEAFLWAVPMTIGAAWCLIGVFGRPTVARIVGLGLFTLGGVFSRSPAGWASALAAAGAAVWFWTRRNRPGEAHVWWSLGLAAAAPVVLGAAVNWAKFNHPWLFPIEDQVATRASAPRRAAIEANGGDLFNPALARSTLPAYLRPDGIRFTGQFPFVTLPAEPAAAVGDDVFDYRYRTGSITAFMPLLTVLAAWGAFTVWRVRRALPARFLIVAYAGAPLGVIAGAYITHRYVADFLPVLIVAGSVGFVDLTRRAAEWSPSVRSTALVGFGVAAAFSVIANTGVAYSAHALGSPGPPLADYLVRQLQFSPGATDSRVLASERLAPRAPADEVHIVGDCRALFVSTGEERNPWTEVGQRAVRFELTTAEVTSVSGPEEIELARFVGLRTTRLVARSAAQPGTTEIALTGGGTETASDPLPVTESGLWVSVDTDHPQRFDVRVDSERLGRVPKFSDDEQFVQHATVLESTRWSPTTPGLAGLTVVRDLGAPTETRARSFGTAIWPVWSDLDEAAPVRMLR